MPLFLKNREMAAEMADLFELHSIVLLPCWFWPYLADSGMESRHAGANSKNHGLIA
jgi:hypothetical protein